MMTPKSALNRILSTASGEQHRPRLSAKNESNVRDVFVIGDLAGAPVIKLAMEQGYNVIDHIAGLPNAIGNDPEVRDVLIVGAGAAGLNAALEAKARGMRSLVLEKEKIANTIENFPEGKWVYAEPDVRPPKGKLWLDGATKEDLVKRWHQIVDDNALDVRTGEALTRLTRRPGGGFDVETTAGRYRARRIVLATGQRGNPRKLGVPGEDRERVYHRLYGPRKYQDEDILVVGGGNSAVEAALVLSEQNRVVLSYRGDSFSRIFSDNERKLNEAVAAGRITTLLESNVTEFGEGAATVQAKNGAREVQYDHAFVLTGAELPVRFLKSLGLKLENEWEGSLTGAAALTALSLCALWLFGGHAAIGDTNLSAMAPRAVSGIGALALLGGVIAWGVRGNRYCWLGVSFLVWYTIYGAKVGKGSEFWPYRDWGYAFLSFGGRPWSFWYTVMYTGLMTVFGLQAVKRWGVDRKDTFQIWRFVSLLAFQWILFFLVPEFLFQLAVKHQWVGEALATDPQFAGQAWRSYGLVYAWPLFFYTFFYDPHQIWVVWGVLLTFVIIPIFVLFHGKRYCSWICGCGGLAETFGDRWRHLAPKGRRSVAWEWMNWAVLIFAAVVTVAMLLRDTYAVIWNPTERGLNLYRVFVDVWLVGILPVTLYPFLGGKVWCRYWCPLAKLMGVQSKLFGKLRIGRFHIVANDKCIGCYECSRNCQVGIPVMQYALKQEVLDNTTSSCIGCGICVTVCPMDTLSFDPAPHKPKTGPQVVNA